MFVVRIIEKKFRYLFNKNKKRKMKFNVCNMSKAIQEKSCRESVA